MQVLNERLRSLRTSSNKTQKQLADFLGVSEVTYQRFEYATRRPSLDNLIKLADYYDISLDFLTGRSNNPEINR